MRLVDVKKSSEFQESYVHALVQEVLKKATNVHMSSSIPANLPSDHDALVQVYFTSATERIKLADMRCSC